MIAVQLKNIDNPQNDIVSNNDTFFSDIYIISEDLAFSA